MKFDVEGNLAAVERSVAFLEKSARPASAVTLSRTYTTTMEDLWDALTNPKRIPRWFAPVSGRLELGGHYAIEGNAGGTITECKRLSHFTLTWEFAGDVSWVEVRVSEEGAETRLTLAHTALLSPHWDEYGAGAVGVGWGNGIPWAGFPHSRPGCPQARRHGIRNFTGWSGLHHRQQRRMGPGGYRSWREPRKGTRGREADFGFLHGRFRISLQGTIGTGWALAAQRGGLKATGSEPEAIPIRKPSSCRSLQDPDFLQSPGTPRAVSTLPHQAA